MISIEFRGPVEDLTKISGRSWVDDMVPSCDVQDMRLETSHSNDKIHAAKTPGE